MSTYNHHQQYSIATSKTSLKLITITLISWLHVAYVNVVTKEKLLGTEHGLSW